MGGEGMAYLAEGFVYFFLGEESKVDLLDHDLVLGLVVGCDKDAAVRPLSNDLKVRVTSQRRHIARQTQATFGKLKLEMSCG